MQPDLRPAVTAIAAAAATGHVPASIYSYEDARHFLFSGSVGGATLSLYDHDRGCHIGGSLPTLYDYGGGRHIQLNTDDRQHFDGYDQASGSHFTIDVNGNNVTIYDHGDGRHHQFAA